MCIVWWSRCRRWGMFAAFSIQTMILYIIIYLSSHPHRECAFFTPGVLLFLGPAKGSFRTFAQFGINIIINKSNPQAYLSHSKLLPFLQDCDGSAGVNCSSQLLFSSFQLWWWGKKLIGGRKVMAYGLTAIMEIKRQAHNFSLWEQWKFTS